MLNVNELIMSAIDGVYVASYLIGIESGEYSSNDPIEAMFDMLVCLVEKGYIKIKK